MLHVCLLFSEIYAFFCCGTNVQLYKSNFVNSLSGLNFFYVRRIVLTNGFDRISLFFFNKLVYNDRVMTFESEYQNPGLEPVIFPVICLAKHHII